MFDVVRRCIHRGRWHARLIYSALVFLVAALVYPRVVVHLIVILRREEKRRDNRAWRGEVAKDVWWQPQDADVRHQARLRIGESTRMSRGLRAAPMTQDEYDEDVACWGHPRRRR